MRAFGYPLQYVLRSDNTQQVGFNIAVQGRKEHFSSGLNQIRAGFDHRGRVGHVFQHFHTGHNIEAAGVFCCKCLSTGAVVRYFNARFQAVKLRYLQRGFSHINTRHICATLSKRFRQNAATAADIQNLFTEQTVAFCFYKGKA